MRNTVTSEALLHWSYWLHNISNAVTHLAVPDVCHFCYYILILRWSSIEKMHGTMESTIFPQRNAECLSDISLWRRPLNQEQCLWLSCTDFHSSWSLKNSNNSRSSNSSDVLVPLLLWKWGRRGHCLFERGACLTLSPRGWVLIQGNAVFFN